MSLADVIRRMAEAGAPPEAIAIAVEAIEGASNAKRQARNRRYYQARKAAAVTRTAALRVPCPYCLAGPGEACKGKRGPRWAVHRDRLGQAAADNVVTFPRRS